MGGIIASIISIFLAESNYTDSDNKHTLATPMLDSELNPKSFSSFISEIVGSFVFVFMFMLCTDKKTQFSRDKVINCFIIASSYISARLMSGGKMVTGRRSHALKYIPTGPLLNPALAFGQFVSTFDLSNWQYIVCPLGGSALALLFYEFIFVKSQEYLNGSADGESSQASASPSASPNTKRKPAKLLDTEEDHEQLGGNSSD